MRIYTYNQGQCDRDRRFCESRKYIYPWICNYKTPHSGDGPMVDNLTVRILTGVLVMAAVYTGAGAGPGKKARGWRVGLSGQSARTQERYRIVPFAARSSMPVKCFHQSPRRVCFFQGPLPVWGMRQSIRKLQRLLFLDRRIMPGSKASPLPTSIRLRRRLGRSR